MEYINRHQLASLHSWNHFATARYWHIQVPTMGQLSVVHIGKWQPETGFLIFLFFSHSYILLHGNIISVGCYSLSFSPKYMYWMFLLTLMQTAAWPLQEAYKHKAVILCVLEIGTRCVQCDKSVRKQINRWILCVTSHSKKWDNHTERSRVKICLEETVTADTLWIFLSPTLCTSRRLQNSWHIKCDTFAPSCKTGINLLLHTIAHKSKN